mmetsp:Transcript_10503/g.25660  ORF Transcript_10503/g.25660 Transcript_10503/m.25660 type:complete len:212 (-) Transcript_10503:956-1591(-)
MRPPLVEFPCTTSVTVLTMGRINRVDADRSSAACARITKRFKFPDSVSFGISLAATNTEFASAGLWIPTWYSRNTDAIFRPGAVVVAPSACRLLSCSESVASSEDGFLLLGASAAADRVNSGCRGTSIPPTTSASTRSVRRPSKPTDSAMRSSCTFRHRKNLARMSALMVQQRPCCQLSTKPGSSDHTEVACDSCTCSGRESCTSSRSLMR